MRFFVLLLCLCLGLPAFAADQTGAELRKKPVRAEIVAKDPSGSREGNVRVTYQDGSSDFWTTKGNCRDAHAAPDGTVGWVVDENLGVPDHPNAFRSKLILCRRGTVVATICSGCPVIGMWYFLAPGKQVALFAGWYHSHPLGVYELYDAATEKLLWSVPESVPEDASKLPVWAKPLAGGVEN